LPQEKIVTPKRSPALDLDVDLEGGVVPISKAASALAALLKRARERHQPIIVTQKGYPAGVLLDVELYTALRARAEAAAAGSAAEEGQAEPAPAPPEVPAEVPEAEEPVGAPKRRGGRRRTPPGEA
jgi:prevent-host-death family protein